MLRIVFAGLIATSLLACVPKNQQVTSASMASTVADDTAALAVHVNYLNAINSNDLETFASMLTEDAVFLAAGAEPIVGKAAVRAWAKGYLQAFKTHWDKPVKEFTISGDYAFERYAYTSTDTPTAGGVPVVATGWGLVIYKKEADGQWRVARDAFAPDHPPAAQ